MQISDFDYNLHKELIAIEPAEPRDSSRLLVLQKKKGTIEHGRFSEIIDYMQAGDVLVLNNTKVFSARLLGVKSVSGGKMEVFLLKNISVSGLEVWECLIGGRGAKAGLKIEFTKGLVAEVVADNADGTWQVKFNRHGSDFMVVVDEIGSLPLPPYIEKARQYKALNRQGTGVNDRKSYQTVYAADEKRGSVAAPTAGLHFTPELMRKIKDKGVQIEFVTLHVGMGTFAPVKVDNILDHKMHAEYVEIEKVVAENIITAKAEKRRIIAVGTTSARALEAMFQVQGSSLKISDHAAWVDIFIYPGYDFKVVDALITNFHLPKSTLLILVSALAGAENIRRAYAEAIEKKYRFYSYGDAMLIV